MFSFFKNLFSRHEEPKEEYQYRIIVKRGHEIILPKLFYETCKENGYNISIVFDKHKKPTSVQVTHVENGKKIYIGTVKKMLNVSAFKNKNVCDFTKENIVEKEIENDKK